MFRIFKYLQFWNVVFFFFLTSLLFSINIFAEQYYYIVYVYKFEYYIPNSFYQIKILINICPVYDQNFLYLEMCVVIKMLF